MSWTTIDKNGGIVEINPNFDLDNMTYDKMLSIESFTDYNFTNSDKFNALASDLKKESSENLKGIDTFFSNISQGLQNSAVLFKYLPLIALGYFILKEHKKGAI